MRPIASLLAGLIVLAVFATIPVVAAAAPSGDAGATGGTVGAQELACAPEEGPPDPETDQLGWENGCWYNESIDVNPEDGLNQRERDLVVARSMARVETVRELEFERTVPVEIISRSEYQDRTDERFANVSTENRLHQNVKWEALFMVGEDTDAIAVQKSNRAASVLGYYSPANDRIVIVSENETSPKLDEITLSQELFHALQDRKFNLSTFNRSTEERNNAANGVIEGDGNLVDYRYEQRCEAEWDCLLPRGDDGGGSGDDIHLGLYFVGFQPYSDGPAFVQEIERQGDWESVDALYDAPPNSTEQTIHPEKYGADEPTPVAINDSSGEEWRVLEMGNDSLNYAEFGEAGLASMLVYPAYASGGQTQIVPVREFLNRTAGGEISGFDPLDYENRYTAGWDGDKLLPYVTNDSAETNETGYVYKTVWDSPREAEQFLEGYYRVLEYRGAEPVEGRVDTYRIPDDRAFGDAFYINRTGATVVIVNAPTVEDLPKVRAGAAPPASTDDGDPGGNNPGNGGIGDGSVGGGSVGDGSAGGGSAGSGSGGDSDPPVFDDTTSVPPEEGDGPLLEGAVAVLVTLIGGLLVVRRLRH